MLPPLFMENGLRAVEWRDEDGRRWYRGLPPQAPDSDAQWGVPLGPPSLKGLGLPAEVEVRLHNELFVRGLLSERSVRRRNHDIQAALMAALNVDVARILAAFRRGTSAAEVVDARSSST